MGLLDSLHRLLGNEAQGVKNIYHGLNPFDKQGFASPVQVPVNHALPARPSAPPLYRAPQPLQGQPSTLNVGSSNLRQPSLPWARQLGAPGIQPTFKSGNVVYRPVLAKPMYDLLKGGWSNGTFGEPDAVPLNTRFYQDEYPTLPQVGRIAP